MKRFIESMTWLTLICVLPVGCTPVLSREVPLDEIIRGENTAGENTPDETAPGADKLLIFHNRTGPMCIEALGWLAKMQSEHPTLLIEEHLTTEPAGLAMLDTMTSEYGQSQGVSASFRYLPVIFFGDQAFSGFNDQVQAVLEALIKLQQTPEA